MQTTAMKSQYKRKRLTMILYGTKTQHSTEIVCAFVTTKLESKLNL